MFCHKQHFILRSPDFLHLHTRRYTLCKALQDLTNSAMYSWRRQWHPTPVLLLENPMDGGAWKAAVHGVAKSQIRLSDFIHFSLSCIGEGNGNPLQCSCLENPRDGRAGWAAVYGVTQSGTRLKRLRSSSSPPFWRRQWQPTPVLLPGRSHGWRSLVGCSPWDC